MKTTARPYRKSTLYRAHATRTFTGAHLSQIAMPLGGIGAGCIALNGYGGLQDFSIRHAPATSALADGHALRDSAFATLYLPTTGLARLVEGPLPVERIYDQGLKAQGYRNGGHEGLPRFGEATFTGEYPFGTVHLTDAKVPLSIALTAWNPFIPLDDHNSSLPCLILEYTLTNTSRRRVAYEFGYHLSHLAARANGQDFSRTRNHPMGTAGVLMDNVEDVNSPDFGSCVLGVIGHEPLVKAMWFRGGWFDSLSALWREISSGTFVPNDGSGSGGRNDRNGGSLLLKGDLDPGASITYPIVIAWHFPNAHLTSGQLKDPNVIPLLADCGPDCACTPSPAWRPYYAAHWPDAGAVFNHVAERFTSLRARTQAFHDTLFRSTLPADVLDAVSANLAIIKSPTVLRQANGNLWGWEGCFASSGCCPGSCTHVWNYAQSIPHLFPALERTLREQELLRSLDERGHVAFRAALPDGPTEHGFHAAADGQLGAVLKVHREWQISGDLEWLRGLYPHLKRSLEYCITHWDPDELGVLMEPHHNTYDIEFWGPDGMCSSIYVAALAAMAVLSHAVGEPKDEHRYKAGARKGARHMSRRLFNGEYYQQNVMLHGLKASPSEADLDNVRQANPNEHALLVSEGPKYQYGTGCLSDGVIGASLAFQCGVETPLNGAEVRRHLHSVFEHNFKASLREHANVQRPGYALGDEPGLLLCTWPRGGKPTLPFVYSDEVWTGIEYQVASHMIAEGLVDEGLTIVHALRSRYDGRVRNPWNEYECGSYYARAMASYGLLAALSGFAYSAPTKRLRLAPRLERLPFTTFFSTASGWGTLTLTKQTLTIRLEEGTLDLRRLEITTGGRRVARSLRATATAHRALTLDLR